MRFKAIPPAPASLETLEAAWRAIPLVPEAEGACCQRVAGRLPKVDRDEARRWIALLRALEVVSKGPTGFTRTRSFPELPVLRHRFVANVVGVEELVEGEPHVLSVDEAFERVRSAVPAWERQQNPNTWETTWRQRTERLLAWGVLFGVFDEVAAGYRLDQRVLDELQT